MKKVFRFTMANSIVDSASLDRVKNALIQRITDFDDGEPLSNSNPDFLLIFNQWIDMSYAHYNAAVTENLFSCRKLIITFELAAILAQSGIDRAAYHYFLKKLIELNLYSENKSTLIEKLVTFNNELGNLNNPLSEHWKSDAALISEINRNICEAISSLDLNKTDRIDDETFFLRHYGLHPVWLIKKHLNHLNTISMLKNLHHKANNTPVPDNFSKPQCRVEDEQPIPLHLSKGAGLSYQSSEDLLAIGRWLDANRRFMAAGTAKGGVHAMADIVVENLACITFMGSLNPASEMLKSESALGHGPHFLLLTMEAVKSCKGKYNPHVWDIPAAEVIFLFQSDNAKIEFETLLIDLYNTGLLSEADLMPALSRAFTYKSFCDAYQIHTDESLPHEPGLVSTTGSSPLRSDNSSFLDAKSMRSYPSSLCIDRAPQQEIAPLIRKFSQIFSTDSEIEIEEESQQRESTSPKQAVVSSV